MVVCNVLMNKLSKIEDKIFSALALEKGWID